LEGYRKIADILGYLLHSAFQYSHYVFYFKLVVSIWWQIKGLKVGKISYNLFYVSICYIKSVWCLIRFIAFSQVIRKGRKISVRLSESKDYIFGEIGKEVSFV
jgi:hypothetical protein